MALCWRIHAGRIRKIPVLRSRVTPLRKLPRTSPLLRSSGACCHGGLAPARKIGGGRRVSIASTCWATWVPTPTSRKSRIGTSVGEISVATDCSVKDATGRWTERTEWHSVVNWGAASASEDLGQGRERAPDREAADTLLGQGRREAPQDGDHRSSQDGPLGGLGRFGNRRAADGLSGGAGRVRLLILGLS